MDLIEFGWRDGILIAVVLAAIYLVLMLVRLTQVGRHVLPARAPEAYVAERIETVSPLRQPAVAKPAVRPEVAVSAYEETAQAEPFAVPSTPTFEWDDVQELFGDEVPAKAPRPHPDFTPAPASTQAPVPDGVAAGSGSFGEALSEHLTRSDMEMAMQRMRDEMEHLRRELDEVRAARRVSPQYAEAMELAQRGLSAQDVADRLGISLGEAELVHALSRGETDFDQGDEDGADGIAGEIVEFGHQRNGRG